MIKKFVKISGTGKFLNYNHSTPAAGYRTTEFEKVNLLYGENGSGKTTLSIILKSLKGNNGLLLKKKAFDRTFTQAIEVYTTSSSNNLHVFTDGTWNLHKPEIEVFDIHFINENIYTGLEIQNIHKKNLFEIIFGQQGIQLKIEIKDIKESIQSTNKEISEATQKIQLAIDNAYTAVDYCNIQTDETIDNKISLKETEIATAKSYQTIKQKAVLSTIPSLILPFDFTTLIEVLSKSIDSISDAYIEKFNIHKGHLSMDGKEEEWLKQGYNSISDNSCPFCLRPFDKTVEVLEAYKQYFNDEYNSLLNSLDLLNVAISNFNLDASLLLAESAITHNMGLIDFWKNHLPYPPALTSIIDQKGALLEAFAKMKICLETKSRNPIKAIGAVDVNSLQTLLDSVNNSIKEFNIWISEYNQKITTLKSSNVPNVIQLETDLKKMKAIKKRSDPTIAALCTKYTSDIQMVNTLNSEKDVKQRELDANSTTIFTSYSAKINQYLRKFAAYLEIRDMNSGYVGSSREPMINYALHINGNEIRQDDNPTLPSFKYSLSEGDKSALALAFFLTKLEVDGNIQNKVILFDDPVSSFDLNRKATTISILTNLGLQAKQLFVLTHNLIFACEFWKSANQLSVTTQCSKIEFISNTACIVEYNIETETLSSILKDSLALKDFLTHGAFTDQEKRGIARCLRPALESYFHLKFFDIVSSGDWLGDFISNVRNATHVGDPFYRLNSSLPEFTDINDYSKKYHHRFNGNNETEPVNDAELRNYCTRTLNLIQVI